MTDWQSVFAATFADEVVANGVTGAVICPGKRSTLVAAALERHTGIRTHVVVDERSAAFFALGMARKLGRPVLLWCTSGTAAAEFHPAVIEASYSRVPLLVCTSDRPPELHSVRDWQSMDQAHLYGNSVRWFFDLGIADESMSSHWRSIVARACLEAANSPMGPGPVHLNVPIREPFSLAPVEPVTTGFRHVLVEETLPVSVDVVGEVAELAASGKRGVFVLGAGEVDADAVATASANLGWPVFAHPRSTAWGVAPVISSFDALLSDAQFATSMAPDLVVHVGVPVLSKALTQWANDAEHWSVEAIPSWQGETSRVSKIIRADASEFFEQFSSVFVPRGWLSQWQDAEKAAQSAIESVFAGEFALTEPFIARSLMRALPDGSNLVCSTSMPVRDVDWWSAPRQGVKVFANRGVSGLDGVTSTAMGVAASSVDEANVLLIGDLGFLHDLNAMWAFKPSNPELQLTIVVVDNAGGGIFARFPMEAELGPDAYEKIVATPQQVDICAVARALGIEVASVEQAADFEPAVAAAIAGGGVRVVYCRTNTQQNIELTKRLRSEVSRALL